MSSPTINVDSASHVSSDRDMPFSSVAKVDQTFLN